MIRHEIRQFMADIGVIGVSFLERLAKLDEEEKELREALHDENATLDDVLQEYADVGIVALTIAERCRMIVEGMGFNFDALMICKMDEVRRRK